MEWIKAPTDQLGKEMVPLLCVVCATLKEIDIQRQADGGPSCHWVLESIEDETRCVRASEKCVAHTPMECFDFVGMYTCLEHS